MSLEDRLYSLLRYYERAPAWLRGPIGSAYRALPTAIRYGRAYGTFKKLARTLEEGGPGAVRAYQTEQLSRVLNEAATYCPWYKQQFAQAGFDPSKNFALEDMAQCPTIDKNTLQQHLEEMVSTRIPRAQRMYITTGGSTGVPVGFYLQKGISRPKEQAFLETMWERAGYRDRARVAVIRGHVTSPSADGTIAYRDTTRNWLVLSSNHLTPDRMPEYFSALEAYQPDFIHAYPSSALQLAEYLEQTGYQPAMKPRALLCGSEQLTLNQKRILQTIFDCPVYRWYGHSERVVLAGEGRTSSLFYFFPTYGYVEFGPPDEDGLQEIIGTSFHNLAMPLIRYRTGDYVRLACPDEPREFPWPAASEIAGRGQEYLISATGRKISLTAFNMHDAIFDGLYAVQFVQDTPGQAQLHYIPSPTFDPTRLELIQRRVLEKLGDDFNLSMTPVQEVEKTTRGKHKWLVSSLPES